MAAFETKTENLFVLNLCLYFGQFSIVKLKNNQNIAKNATFFTRNDVVNLVFCNLLSFIKKQKQIKIREQNQHFISFDGRKFNHFWTEGRNFEQF